MEGLDELHTLCSHSCSLLTSCDMAGQQHMPHIHVPEEDVVAVGVWLASSSLETVPWQPPYAHEPGQYPMLLHHSGRGGGKEGVKEEIMRALPKLKSVT